MLLSLRHILDENDQKSSRLHIDTLMLPNLNYKWSPQGPATQVSIIIMFVNSRTVLFCRNDVAIPCCWNVYTLRRKKLANCE